MAIPQDWAPDGRHLDDGSAGVATTAVFAAFRSATSALAAVVQIQQLLSAGPWPTSIPRRVRIGLHGYQADLDRLRAER